MSDGDIFCCHVSQKIFHRYSFFIMMLLLFSIVYLIVKKFIHDTTIIIKRLYSSMYLKFSYWYMDMEIKSFGELSISLDNKSVKVAHARMDKIYKMFDLFKWYTFCILSSSLFHDQRKRELGIITISKEILFHTSPNIWLRSFECIRWEAST